MSSEERLKRIVSTDLKASPGDLCPLGFYHAGIESWVSHSLSLHRADVGIEHSWSLVVEVVCPSSFSGQKEHEAQIEWDSEVWFARVSLCCSLPFDLRQWVLIHELYELKHWRTGDAFHNLASLLPPSELRDLVIHQFHQARNQEIEQEVGQYLGQRRPNHMTTTTTQSQPRDDEKKREELVDHLRMWREEDDIYAAEVNRKAFLAQLREEEPNILTLTEEEMENIRL